MLITTKPVATDVSASTLRMMELVVDFMVVFRDSERGECWMVEWNGMECRNGLISVDY